MISPPNEPQLYAKMRSISSLFYTEHLHIRQFCLLSIINYPTAEQRSINRNIHNRTKGRGIYAPRAHRTIRPPLADLSHKFFYKLRVKSPPGALSLAPFTAGMAAERSGAAIPHLIQYDCSVLFSFSHIFGLM